MNQLTIRSWFHPFCILSRFLSSFERINCNECVQSFLWKENKNIEPMHVRTLTPRKNPLESNIHWCHISSIWFFVHFVSSHWGYSVPYLCLCFALFLLHFWLNVFDFKGKSMIRRKLFRTNTLCGKNMLDVRDRRFSCRLYKHKYGVSTSKLELSPTPATKTKKKEIHRTCENATRFYACSIYSLSLVLLMIIFGRCSVAAQLRLPLRRVQSFFALCSISQTILLVFLSFVSSFIL